MFTPHTHAKVAYNKLREGSAVGTAQQARKEKNKGGSTGLEEANPARGGRSGSAKRKAIA